MFSYRKLISRRKCKVRVKMWLLPCVLWMWCVQTVLCQVCPKSADRPLETRVQDATMVFRGVIVQTHMKARTIELALVSVYRGGSELGAVSPYSGSPYNTTDRQVVLKVSSHFMGCFEWNQPKDSLNELVVFARISDFRASWETTLPADGPWLETSDAAIPWTVGVDVAIWSSVGWGGWGEWGACSRSCGGGEQVRRRACGRPPPAPSPCEGAGVHRRTCNMFRCQDAVNPLASSSRKSFHPSQATWAPVADRPGAFSLRPNSYIWIASSQVFPKADGFPRKFTMFITLRLRPESGGYGQGTLVSLVSRRRGGAHLSLELAGRGGARLVHAGAGASRALSLHVALHDFRWHRIAISVHDDSTVKSYVDCRWQRTDVLKKDSLDTPKDADLIIGYLFSGDLEQLVIVPEADIASQQCSSNVIPIYNEDDELDDRLHDRHPYGTPTHYRPSAMAGSQSSNRLDDSSSIDDDGSLDDT